MQRREGKIAAVGNGVPLAMGRAVAAAVRRALPAAPIEFEAPRARRDPAP